MRELVRRLLRFRIVRWPFYRLVSLRNYLVAGVRWSRNLLVWFIRATYYRSLFARNWVWFACRWLANYAAWLARLVWHWLRAMLAMGPHVLRSRGRAALLPTTSTDAVVQAHLSAAPMGATARLQPVEPITPPAPQVDAMIVVHAYHIEALPPLLDAIAHLQSALEYELPLLITTSADRCDAVRDELDARGLIAEVVIVENRGRDILPFLTLARDGRLNDACLVLKLHTKLSRHRADGEEWRDALVQGLADADACRRALARAKAGEQFVAVPQQFVFGARDWGKNVRRTGQLAASLGIQRLPFRFRFAAGTMFWITHGLITRLAQVPVTAEEFEPEPLPLDGALPHALERLVGVIAQAEGVGVLALESL